LKTKLSAWLRTYWLVLTEVPGWPDAPSRVRVRRAAPIALPCLGMIALLVWQFGVLGPRIRAKRVAMRPLVGLENEITTLQIACSEQQAADLTKQAEAASRLLLASPTELPAFLASLKVEAAGRGWDAAWTAAPPNDDASAGGALVRYLPVRGKLVPAKDAVAPFASLVSLLERFSSSGKRIDLIRLAIRADEHRWTGVEMNFRLVCPADEKTP
jgi:hypothetical protein